MFVDRAVLRRQGSCSCRSGVPPFYMYFPVRTQWLILHASQTEAGEQPGENGLRAAEVF